MSETNGSNDKPEPRQESGDNGRNPTNGQFVKGNAGGPGRPAGTVDFMSICRRKAKESGIDLDHLVWSTAAALFAKAASGDPAAARVILDRTCGPVEKAVEINVDARKVELRQGPPIPEGKDLGDYIIKLSEVAIQQGLIDPES